MPGPIIQNPIPDWLQAQNASVTDSSLTKALRMIGHLIGADNPTTQVIGLMATDLPGEAPTGGLAKAVGDLWERAKTIRAFHGSPHDFEQFSTAKIGTGEGAQAYGHGLYFAEKEGVAKGYKERLSAAYSNTPQETAQQALKLHGDRQVAAAQLADRVKNLEQAQGLRQQATTLIDAPVFDRARYDLLTHQADSLEGGALATHPAEIEKLREASRILASGQPLEGRMYEVAIKAAPEDFLDWDKPLSQQPEAVRSMFGYVERPTQAETDAVFALAKRRGVNPATMPEYKALEKRLDVAAKLEQDYQSGSDIYRQLAKQPDTVEMMTNMDGQQQMLSVQNRSDAMASERLRQAGIPGVKYLDQGSRGKTGGQLIDTFEQGGKWFAKIRKPSVSQGIGNAPADMFTTSMPFPSKDAATAWANDQINSGTHNYVVFDDKLVDILKKYGIVLPAAGAASQMGTEKP